MARVLCPEAKKKAVSLREEAAQIAGRPGLDSFVRNRSGTLRQFYSRRIRCRFPAVGLAVDPAAGLMFGFAAGRADQVALDIVAGIVDRIVADIAVGIALGIAVDNPGSLAADLVRRR